MSYPVSKLNLQRLLTRYDFTNNKGHAVAPKVCIHSECPITVIQTEPGEPAIAVITTACEQDHISVMTSTDRVDIHVGTPKNWETGDDKEQRTRMGELTIALGVKADSLIIQTNREGIPVTIDAVAKSISVDTLNNSNVTVKGESSSFVATMPDGCHLTLTGEHHHGRITAQSGNRIRSTAELSTLNLSTTGTAGPNTVNHIDITKAKFTEMCIGDQDTTQAVFTLAGQTMGLHITPQTVTIQNVPGHKLDALQSSSDGDEDTVTARVGGQAVILHAETTERPRQIDRVVVPLGAIRHG